ncbi:MAG: DUF885 domain-containing protein [Xanthomonadales bacterium]|jgi:hypothetical protein|nr:DUF885 domain-containing protein [Xanthomonadales bacterium]MDH3942246.1 DUF885 domain-containing protein [Xanthomonadales bacterium]MDH4001102.1 DUF885 domain-containing protein [Xanthomonadales bacterium]
MSLEKEARTVNFLKNLKRPVELLALCCLLLAGELTAQSPADGIPAGRGSYQDLVVLFDEFRVLRDDQESRQDFSPSAISDRLEQMAGLQARIADMNVVSWDRPRQVDYLAVRSRLDQYDFTLKRSRPWARDPGFYVDRMLQVTFTELPVQGEALEALQAKLTAIPELVDAARENLDDVAADYADLAIYNLRHPDGVGHGHPYREIPPAGVVGWYDDLLERTQVQPELAPAIHAAREAVLDFEAWLEAERPGWTASAGVGEAAFDWYLRHVKLMPWSSAELVLLGKRELDRLWADFALERNRNRSLPELQPATSAQDYQQRIAATDQRIRKFLQEQEIITVPSDIGELGTNAPWIVRAGGRNFWEEVQFRDPSPDHLHAVIPGHRFDLVLASRNEHPIRSKIDSGARVEGWATYLEEAMLQAGLFEDLPRVRELIQIFGIFRAARVPADVWLQTRQMNVEQVVDYWLPRVPYLDRNVARVDAEIYLRRPPGYGIGYTIGALQMERLLADRKRQLGDSFNLKAFHDDLMAAGLLPLSLIRWDMTGLDDEVKNFWVRQPMPD